MSDSRVFVLRTPDIRSRAASYVLIGAPENSVCAVRQATRTLEQNAAQWPILQAFAEQLPWSVNGELVHMTDEEWKDVLTAAFHQETVRLARGLNGGVVMLGRRTSKFPKGKFSEWLEFLHATAADRGVVVYPEDARC